MKRILCILLCALLCLSVLFGCSNQGEEIIARVEERQVSFSDFLDTLDYYVYYMGVDTQDSSSKETVMQLAETILQSMVLSEVVLAKGEELGYYEFSEEEKSQIQSDIQAEMDAGRESIEATIKEENPDLSEEELKTKVDLEMATQGYIEEDFRTYFEDSLVYDKVYAHFTEDVTVSEEEIRAEYDRLVEEAQTSYLEGTSSFEDDALLGGTIYYTPAGYRRVKHILIGFDSETSTQLNELSAAGDEEAYQAYLEEALAAIRSEAEGVLAQVNADGSNFAELMETYSDDPGASYYPDGYVVGQENSTYHESFVEGVFALENPGDISGLVASPSGYHIIRLEEILQEGAAAYEDVKESVSTSLLETRQSDTFYDLSETWQEEMDVKTYPEKYQVYLDNYYAELEAEETSSAEKSASAEE